MRTTRRNLVFSPLLICNDPSAAAASALPHLLNLKETPSLRPKPSDPMTPSWATFLAQFRGQRPTNPGGGVPDLLGKGLPHLPTNASSRSRDRPCILHMNDTFSRPFQVRVSIPTRGAISLGSRAFAASMDFV